SFEMAKLDLLASQEHIGKKYDLITHCVLSRRRIEEIEWLAIFFKYIGGNQFDRAVFWCDQSSGVVVNGKLAIFNQDDFSVLHACRNLMFATLRLNGWRCNQCSQVAARHCAIQTL
ncbi:hypothetical protein VP01_9048g1, partial [Puccinia sorghi]